MTLTTVPMINADFKFMTLKTVPMSNVDFSYDRGAIYDVETRSYDSI